MKAASAGPKWIRRAGLAYGVWRVGFVLQFLMTFLTTLLGMPDPSGLELGLPAVVGALFANALNAALLLMPYRKIARWRGGTWTLIAFVLFIVYYIVYVVRVQILFARQGMGFDPLSICFHVVSLSILVSNCGLLYLWLRQAQHPPAAASAAVGGVGHSV